jgi:tetratricopeptide (TPR) repeat protein
MIDSEPPTRHPKGEAMVRTLRVAAGMAAILALLVPAGPVVAASGSFGDRPGVAGVGDEAVAQIQRALDEQRYLDAGRMLNQAMLTRADDPRLVVLAGELNLSRARYNDALTSFKSIEASAAVRARALQGQGIALSLLGRSAEAMSLLQAAVKEDASSWRAWNAIATEYDRRRDWAQAEAAYDRALTQSGGTQSGGAASVLNNRGFSRLLQSRFDEAVSDFVAALEKKADLAPARTNLRLALAMKGEYGRSVAGAGRSDRAALLNNAGFAAMLRGDYAQAESLLNQAMQAKGEYYARASANLERALGLQAQGNSTSGAAELAPP